MTQISSVLLVFESFISSTPVLLSKSLVHRTMRYVLKYKLYELHLTQQVYNDDQDLGVEMAELLTSIIDDQENYGLIFFSGEATFHLSGFVNEHNCRIWVEKNPFLTIDVAMNSPKITVWCAMSCEEIRAIRKETLYNVFLKVKKRLNFCIEVQGDAFKQYL